MTRYVLSIGLALVVILFVVAYVISVWPEKTDDAAARMALSIGLALSAGCDAGRPERASDIQNLNAISDDIAAVTMTQSPARARTAEVTPPTGSISA